MASIDSAQLGIDFSKKKKKKRSSKKTTEEGSPVDSAQQSKELESIEKEAAQMFGLLAQKKKKKSKRRTTVAAVANDDDEDDVADLIEQLKSSKVSKKKSAKKAAEKPAPAEGESPTAASGSYWNTETDQSAMQDQDGAPETALTALERMKNSPNFGEKDWVKSDRDYLYEELLDRVFTLIQKQNPELGTGTRKKFRIKPPQIAREPRKTIFVNLQEICENIRRDPEHVISYIFTELGTTGSIDAEKRLVIRGVFNAKNMEIVIRKYIAEYVGCRGCGSLDTLLKRDPNTRLYSLNCLNCGATRTAATIRQGFLANTTPRRRRK